VLEVSTLSLSNIFLCVLGVFPTVCYFVLVFHFILITIVDDDSVNRVIDKVSK
jgi:hypothetical protein